MIRSNTLCEEIILDFNKIESRRNVEKRSCGFFSFT